MIPRRRIDRSWLPLVVAVIIMPILAMVNLIDMRDPRALDAAGTPQVAPVPASAATPILPVDLTTQVQYVLRSYGYTIAVDGWYGPQTTNRVQHWQTANGLTPDGVAGPLTRASLGIEGSAEPGIASGAQRGPSIQATEPPEPPEPPAPGPPAGSSNCEQMFWWRDHFGLPADFDSIGQRESGVGQCENTAISPTGCCVGWWQLHYINFKDHRMIEPFAACGATWLNVRGEDTDSKRRQACATAALYREVGYTPWKI